MITSRSVKPDGRCSAKRITADSVADVAIFSLAAFLAIGAQRNQVERLALAGELIAIVVAPGILEIGVFCVRAIPALYTRGLLHECGQVIGVAAHFELIELDLAHELLETDFRFARFCPPHLLENLWAHKGHDAGEQDEDDHDLEDGEAAVAALRRHRVSHHKSLKWEDRKRRASRRGWR